MLGWNLLTFEKTNMGCDIHFYVERKIDGVWQQQFNTATIYCLVYWQA